MYQQPQLAVLSVCLSVCLLLFQADSISIITAGCEEEPSACSVKTWGRAEAERVQSETQRAQQWHQLYWFFFCLIYMPGGSRAAILLWFYRLFECECEGERRSFTEQNKLEGERERIRKTKLERENEWTNDLPPTSSAVRPPGSSCRSALTQIVCSWFPF